MTLKRLKIQVKNSISVCAFFFVVFFVFVKTYGVRQVCMG